MNDDNKEERMVSYMKLRMISEGRKNGNLDKK